MMTFSWQGYKSFVSNSFMGLPTTTQSVSYLGLPFLKWNFKFISAGTVLKSVKFYCLTSGRGKVTLQDRPAYRLLVSPTKQLKKQLRITVLAQILRGENNKTPEV